MHFSWYFRYMEEAEHALWRAAGLSIADPASPVGFPRVAATCDYQAPLRFEDEVEVVVRIEAINKRSIKYACTIVRGEMTVATGTMTAACVDKTSGAAIHRSGDPARRSSGSSLLRTRGSETRTQVLPRLLVSLVSLVYLVVLVSYNPPPCARS